MAEGLGCESAVLCAQEAGFAEADPSLDVDGEDAAQKLAILAQLAFDAPIREGRVTGIRDVTPEDIERARAEGCVLRQVAEASRVAGGVTLTVEPRRVPLGHPFARVVDEQNAVVIVPLFARARQKYTTPCVRSRGIGQLVVPLPCATPS